jgi:hypothetical protein
VPISATLTIGLDDDKGGGDSSEKLNLLSAPSRCCIVLIAVSGTAGRTA